MNFSAFNSASFNASGGTPVVLGFAALTGNASIVGTGNRLQLGVAAATAIASIIDTSVRTTFATVLIDSPGSVIAATATRILIPTATVANSAEMQPYAVIMRLATADIFSDMSLSVGSIANPTVLDPAWRYFTREANVVDFVRPADVVFRRVA